MIYFNLRFEFVKKKATTKATATTTIFLFFYAIFVHITFTTTAMLYRMMLARTIPLTSIQIQLRSTHFNGAPFKAFASVATINIVTSTPKKKPYYEINYHFSSSLHSKICSLSRFARSIFNNALLSIDAVHNVV